MENYVTLHIELQAIKDFLNKTLDAVDFETANICKRKESGEFLNTDDFSNVLFAPMEREAIAIRAVFYEINSLIEWELHNLAAKDVPIDKATSIKFVCDMPIGKVQDLIERYYKINFSDMPSFTEVQQIRRTVNAFKHRNGFKDFRRDKVSKIPDKFQPSRENAYQAIDAASIFLKALQSLKYLK